MKSKMMDIKHACGHVQALEVSYSNASARDSRVEYLEAQDCMECQRAASVAAFDEKYTMPALTGTEKQVAWAEQLRAYRVQSLAGQYEGKDRWPVLYAAMQKMDHAKDWINSRGASDGSFMEQLEQYKPEVVEAEAAIDEELTVIPEGADWQVKMMTSPTTITIKSEKDETTRRILKGQGMRFEYGSWKISATSIYVESVTDKAAEIGNALLSHGVAVIFDDQIIKEKALSGEFDPVGQRILYAKGNDFFAVIPYSGDSLRYFIKSGGGSWDSSAGAWKIPAVKYDFIYDLEQEGFYIKESARKLIAWSEAVKTEKIMGVKREVTDYTKQDGIIDDLKD